MSDTVKTRIKILSSLLLLVALLGYLSKSQISFLEVMKAFAHFSPAGIGLAFVLVALQNILMAIRIWILFPKDKKIRLKTAFHGVFYGQTVNTFVPARAGDVLKALIFSKGSSSMMLALGVILADKLIDVSGLLLLILGSGSYKVSPNDWSLPSISVGTIFFTLLFCAIVTFAIRFFIRKKWDQLKNWWNVFRKGLTGILTARATLFALIVTLFAWLSEAYTLKILCSGQGFEMSLSQSVFLLSLLNLAIAIPISVANLGPFEASIVFGLGKFGVATSSAVAVAAAHHSLQMVTLLALTGLIALARMAFPESSRTD